MKIKISSNLYDGRFSNAKFNVEQVNNNGSVTILIGGSPVDLFKGEYEVVEEKIYILKEGDVYERKCFEYTVMSKVKHENKDGYVYLLKIREKGQELVKYSVCEDGIISEPYYKKIN